MYRQTDRQTDAQTDTQTDMLIERQTKIFAFVNR